MLVPSLTSKRRYATLGVASEVVLLRAHIYLSGRTLETLDQLARETGHSRSEVVADAVARYAEQREVLEHLKRIEELLASGAVRVPQASGDSPASAAQTAADRSMDALRAWATRDDEEE